MPRMWRGSSALLPYIANEPVLALKGGTAINLFHRDMPRLSVDIDLTYLPVRDRAESLADINETLDRIAAAIEGFSPAAFMACPGAVRS